MLRVEEVTRAEDLRGYRVPWTDLETRAEDGELFTTYDWMDSWLPAFWADKPIAFQFVWRGDRLEGMVPLLDDVDGELWCQGSLVTPVNPHTARLNVLTTGAGEVLDAVLRTLEDRRRTVRLGVKHLPLDGSAAKSLLRAAARHRLRTTVRRSHDSPFVTVAGGWEAYLRSRSSHVRHELRRKRRVIERAGEVTCLRVTDPDEVETAMCAVLEIDGASWKHAAGTSLLADRDAAAFYLELGRRCAQTGSLRLYLLFLDGAPLAYVYAIRYRNAVYALSTSYRAEAGPLSPGTVLVGHMLEEVMREGCTVVDFLGAEYAWKRQLATHSRCHVNLCLFSPGQPRCSWCRLVEHGIKPLIREHAPGLMALKRRLSPRPYLQPGRR